MKIGGQKAFGILRIYRTGPQIVTLEKWNGFYYKTYTHAHMPACALSHTKDTKEHYSFKTHLKYISRSNDITASINEA